MDWKFGTLVTLSLCVAIPACADDGSPALETESGTSDSTSTSTSTSTTTDTTTTTTGITTMEETTSSTTTASSDSDGSSSSSGGSMDGVCLGFDLIGPIADVLSRNEANIAGNCSATPAPCGGDEVGEWTYENNCGEDNLENIFAALCPGATQVVNARNNVGTLTFQDNGNFTQQNTTALELTIGVDVQTCLGASCGQFQAVLNDLDGVDATCSGPDTACDCTVDVTDTTNMSGTYTTADNEITMTVDDQDLPAIPYCVSGDRLDLWTPSYQTTITEEVCQDANDCAEALGDQNELYACDFDQEMMSTSQRWLSDLSPRP